jgi:hypothetical protein
MALAVFFTRRAPGISLHIFNWEVPISDPLFNTSRLQWSCSWTDRGDWSNSRPELLPSKRNFSGTQRIFLIQVAKGKISARLEELSPNWRSNPHTDISRRPVEIIMAESCLKPRMCVCVFFFFMECHAVDSRLTTAILATPGFVTFLIASTKHAVTNVLFTTKQRLKQTTRRLETVSKYVCQQHFS